MSLTTKLLAASGGLDKLYSDDVFVSYTRTGTGADAIVTTGIDMTKGYMLWSKGRSGATDHAVYDSARGLTLDLVTNSTAAQTTQVTGLKAVSSTGHTVGSLAKMNTVAATYVDWVCRNAKEFFQVLTVTKSAGSNLVIDLSPYMTTPGMVKVKRADAAGSWYVWHRSLTAGQLLIGESTAVAATLGQITVVGTTLTLVNGVIADGSYHVECYARDTSADGIVQCGSYVGAPNVTLGWEPQYLLVKPASVAGDWYVLDTSRRYEVNRGESLSPNTSAAEGNFYIGDYLTPTATGFKGSAAIFGAGATTIYLAIRRSNKPPTVGTQVYSAIARTGTGAAATVTGVGFAPDLAVSHNRTAGFNYNWGWCDRLRGTSKDLNSATTAAEDLTHIDTLTAWGINGVSLGGDVYNGSFNIAGGVSYITNFFKRAPGVFSILCDAGTAVNKLESHNLGSIPELMIRKSRSAATQWEVYFSSLGNTKKLVLNSTAAEATDITAWNSTSPTATQVSIGTGSNVNTNAATYVTYLFSTLAGISKVFSYTGDGTSGQTINCGFSSGARFILLKRADSIGDWFCWDSVRGVVAGNDPHLSLNTNAAEVTTDDTVDPVGAGFVVNQVTATNCNVNGATYVGLAIS